MNITKRIKQLESNERRRAFDAYQAQLSKTYARLCKDIKQCDVSNREEMNEAANILWSAASSYHWRHECTVLDMKVASAESALWRRVSGLLLVVLMAMLAFAIVEGMQ